MNLKNKKVIITGATGGIGKSLVKKFSEGGSKILATGTNEEKLKEYKDTSRRWIEMGPEVASVEIQNWRQKRRFEEALTIFELLKPEEKAPIISFMLNSDDDSMIELADALAMRDRGLLPSLNLDSTKRGARPQIRPGISFSRLPPTPKPENRARSRSRPT